jgi:hypothetical protein
MAGTLTATTIQNDTSSPPTFRNNSVEIGTLCRAWVNFNGTGTVAIRASFNVSSITDNGTGDYTINFTNAFADANYAITATGTGSGGSGPLIAGRYPLARDIQSTTQVAIFTMSFAGSGVDCPQVSVAIFR